jgi:hypothetical protein
VARTAEEFARRVASDAGQFARRMSREWRHARRHGADWGEDDIRAVLKGVRAILTDVIDGVDELIDRVFSGGERGERPPAAEWTRVVANREAACGACGRRIGPGEECHLRRCADGREFRCAECGVPKPSNDRPTG